MTNPDATILIVDDELQNRKLLERLLRSEGYVTQSVASGEEALASIAEHAPDLILLDIKMPGMDGYEVASRLKADPVTSDIPIIMVTALIDRSARLAGLNAGVEEFVTKPVDLAELSLRLRNLLRLKAFAELLRKQSWALEREVAERTAELQKANDSLRESEARFRALTAMSSDFYWESDAEHRLSARESANKKLSAVSVFERGAQIGERRWEIPHISPDEAGWRAHRAVLDAHLPFREFELSRIGDEGTLRHISISGDPMFSSSGAFAGYRGVGMDITVRKAAERRILYLNRVYAVLGGINTLIVHAHDHDKLFGEACSIALDQGGFRMVWIGIVDRSANKIILAGSAGVNDALLTGLRRVFSLSQDDTLGTTIAAQVVRERKRIVINDLPSNPLVAFGKQYAESGIDSMAVLPLLISDEAVGVLTLYASERDFFHEEELKLLTELAGDIAFAIDNINREKKLAKLARVRAVSSGVNAAIIRISNRDELFNEVCRIAVDDGGLRVAVICIAEPGTMRIVPVASSGMDKTLLAALKGHLSPSRDAAEEETNFARVIREKKALLFSVSPDNPTIVFAKKRSGSTAVLPLLVADEAVGVFALYAEEPGYFDEEEMELLAELAGNIAFAIDHIDKGEKLNYLAYYDELTGLAKRTLFLKRMAQYMRSAAGGGNGLAVFLVDLERFKNINDSLGRPAGDALLRQVAEWLTRNAGDANLVARTGADHFALVLPQVRQEGDVRRLIGKTMTAFLEHPFRLNDAVFRISARVGVAIYPADGADAETLFRNAEAALKKTKTSGDRYLFYAQKMTDSVAGKLTLENQLRLALEDREFVLHYQPKVNLVSGKLTGAEALIRWNDPRTGLVPPGRFIPILEETGLINEVGRWALRQAMEDYLRWRAAGLPAVRIAVNVSPLQLRNRGFIDEIKQAIGIDVHAAAGLELEITENLIMADVKGTIASLGAIRAMGVTVAIDDFGTGFSSLSYLAKLPVDTLKIDRSFVIEMTASAEGLALVSAIISLAHALKLKVVAEGVETEEQLRLLRVLSCDEMQGFLFSKPVPSEIFEAKFLALPPTG